MCLHFVNLAYTYYNKALRGDVLVLTSNEARQYGVPNATDIKRGAPNIQALRNQYGQNIKNVVVQKQEQTTTILPSGQVLIGAKPSTVQAISGLRPDIASGNVKPTPQQEANRLATGYAKETVAYITAQQRIAKEQEKNGTIPISNQQVILAKKEQVTSPYVKSNQKVEKPISEVRAAPTFIAENRIQKLAIKTREEASKTDFEASKATGYKKIGTEAKLFALGVAVPVTQTLGFYRNPIKGSKQLYASGKEFIKDPKTKIASTVESIGETFAVSPSYALGQTAGYIATPIAETSLLKSIKTPILSTVTKLDPKYSPVVVESGEQIIKVRDYDIVVKGGVASTAKSLQEQATYAGKEGIAVSAQRNFKPLFGNEVTIKSPPAEKYGQFYTPSKDLTTGYVRTSRLGSGSSVSDIFSSELTLIPEFTKRPQIIVTKTAVEDFPNSLLDIKSSLLKGIPLTKSQESRLFIFQTTPSGYLKPIGKVTKELEVTLPVGESVRLKKTGVTFIEKTRVPIYEAEVIKYERGNIMNERFNIVRKSKSSKPEVISEVYNPKKPIYTELYSGIISTSKPLMTSPKIISQGSVKLNKQVSVVSVTPIQPRPKKDSDILPKPAYSSYSFVGKGSGYTPPLVSQPYITPPSYPPQKTTPFIPTYRKIPKIDLGDYGRKRTNRNIFGLKLRGKYSPSVAAFLVGAKTKKKQGKRIFGGFEIRPIEI